MRCSIGSCFAPYAQKMSVSVQGDVCAQFAPWCELQNVFGEWFVFDLIWVNACRWEHCWYCCVWIYSIEHSKGSMQNIAEDCSTYSLHAVFCKWNIAVHVHSSQWTILWFVLWGDRMAFCKHQGWKWGQFLFDNTVNLEFCLRQDCLTFGNGLFDKTVHKKTHFW